MQSCWWSLLILALPLAVFAQTAIPRYDIPRAVPPSSCSLTLAQLGMVAGPVASQRLAFQLKALQTAQIAVSALKSARVDLLKERSPALGMSAFFTGTERAHDALLCSASVIAKYSPIDQTDSNARTLLIVAYNQEAAAIADLEAHAKEQFLRPENDVTPATQVYDAERMTAISSLHNEAALTLAEVTSLSLILSVDNSNANAKDTKQTLIPCAQFSALLRESTALSQQTKSDYTDSASFFVKFLSGRRCR
jgi:hypothetical protein